MSMRLTRAVLSVKHALDEDCIPANLDLLSLKVIGVGMLFDTYQDT